MPVLVLDWTNVAQTFLSRRERMWLFSPKPSAVQGSGISTQCLWQRNNQSHSFPAWRDQSSFIWFLCFFASSNALSQDSCLLRDKDVVIPLSQIGNCICVPDQWRCICGSLRIHYWAVDSLSPDLFFSPESAVHTRCWGVTRLANQMWHLSLVGHEFMQQVSVLCWIQTFGWDVCIVVFRADVFDIDNFSKLVFTDKMVCQRNCLFVKGASWVCCI